MTWAADTYGASLMQVALRVAAKAAMYICMVGAQLLDGQFMMISWVEARSK